jgi:hypothetical protein
MNTKITALAIGALLTMSSLAARADTGFYLGVSAGNATIDGTVPSTSTSIDETDTGYKAYAGFRLLSLLAVEGGYVDFGKPSGASGEVDLTGWDLFAVLNLPIGPIQLFAKAGVINWDAEAQVGGVKIESDGNDPAVGAGVAVRIGSFGVRAEYEYFDVQDYDNVSMYSIGLEYSF